jgi:hypothetical protein
MATNPLRGVMLIQDEASGQWLREVCRLHDSRWSARRYESERWARVVIIADAGAAEQHIGKHAVSLLQACGYCEGDADGRAS